MKSIIFEVGFNQGNLFNRSRDAILVVGMVIRIKSLSIDSRASERESDSEQLLDRKLLLLAGVVVTKSFSDALVTLTPNAAAAKPRQI